MLPVQITLRDIPHSPVLDTTIRKRTEKLSQFNDRIIHCRVVAEWQQKHKHQGKLYNVRIEVSVPGKRLVVTRHYDEDIYVALRDAFDALERKLEEHDNKRHGRVKTHNGILRGHIVRLLPEEGYGFIEGTDGTQYYFSITNVSYPSFAQLAIGDAVEYTAEPLNEGWHAHHVTLERHSENS